MAIQVVCSLMLVQRADCYQNSGSCTSCSLCAAAFVPVWYEPTLQQMLLVYKSPKEDELARTVFAVV